jgi:hypothetical protein
MTKRGMFKNGPLSRFAWLMLWVLVLGSLPGMAMAASPDQYLPLWSYNGTWQVSRQDRSPGVPPDKLINTCSQTGHFFVCEQTVNGGPAALLIFIPAGKPGRYYTQNIRPEGRAGGRGDLEIEGNKWVYTSTWDEGGHTVYYRTTNVFQGRASIHYEQAESNDNKNWVVKNSGEEVRVPGTKGAKP